MSYEIHNTEEGVVLELKHGVTARHVAELGKSLASYMRTGSSVIVRAREVDDIDTCVLQMLISLRKTAAAFVVDDPSDAFVNTLERAALRRELLAGAREDS